MITLINEFTDMPDWHRKIFNSKIVFEWKSAKIISGRDITLRMVDWVGYNITSNGRLDI